MQRTFRLQHSRIVPDDLVNGVTREFAETSVRPSDDAVAVRGHHRHWQRCQGRDQKLSVRSRNHLYTVIFSVSSYSIARQRCRDFRVAFAAVAADDLFRPGLYARVVLMATLRLIGRVENDVNHLQQFHRDGQLVNEGPSVVEHQ